MTPKMVREKQFTTTRLLRGYEQAEVDTFLDLVESEVALLIRERDAALARLRTLQQRVEG